jgi:hypothetical protein
VIVPMSQMEEMQYSIQGLLNAQTANERKSQSTGLKRHFQESCRTQVSEPPRLMNLLRFYCRC